MILPIGHEDGTVARVPVVTLGVAALCVLAHLLVLGQGDVERRIQERWQEAVEYALAHPELETDPALVPDELVPDELATALQASGAVDPAPGSQQRLDELTAQWRAALHQHPLWRHGLVPAQPRALALLTHQFLHGGWLHLLGNLLVLYLTGPFLEDAWGRLRFAAFYLLSGVVAGGLYALGERGLDAPLVGASGAVAGVLGAFLLLRGRSRLRFAVFLGFVGTFSAPAWVMLPLWFLFQLLDALAGDVVGDGGGGVAYWAHVWGFLFGLAAAAAMQRWRPVPTHAAAGATPPGRRDPRLAEARRLLDRGLYPRAWELLAGAAQRPSADVEALAAWWGLAVHLGRQREAVAAGRELLRRLAQAERWDEAFAHLATLGATLDPPELSALELRFAEAASAHRADAARELVASLLARELAPPLRTRAERLRDRLSGAGAAQIRRAAADTDG
jgi:membrane associated rhomboid family serine protease